MSFYEKSPEDVAARAHAAGLRVNNEGRYRVFIKYCVFSIKFCDFSELCQFCYSAGVLPDWCVYAHRHRGQTEFGIFLKNRKKTQYLMNTLYIRDGIAKGQLTNR